MQYQIQKYQKADQTKREIVSETKKFDDATQANNWFAEQTKETKTDDESAICLVPETHEWFKPPVNKNAKEGTMEQTGVGPNVSTVSGAKSPSDQAAGRVPTFDEIARYEREKNQKLRVQQLEDQQNFQAAMSQLSQQRPSPQQNSGFPQ